MLDSAKKTVIFSIAVVPSLFHSFPRMGGYNPDIISFSTLLAACEQRWTFFAEGLDQLAEFAVARTLRPRRKMDR